MGYNKEYNKIFKNNMGRGGGIKKNWRCLE